MSITVREWIEKFNNGEFDSKDIKTQCVAGWIACGNRKMIKQ